MSIFTTMYGYVETAISTSVANFGSGLVSFVAAPLGVAATIYFLLLGFAVLRGAIQAPLRELVFQAGKVGFAIAAASAVGYSAFVVNVATNLPAEIIAAGSGTAISNPGTTFDEYASDAGKLAKIMDAQNATVQTLTIGGTLISSFLCVNCVPHSSLTPASAFSTPWLSFLRRWAFALSSLRSCQ
jgi:type IV secretion system protein VirB6